MTKTYLYCEFRPVKEVKDVCNYCLKEGHVREECALEKPLEERSSYHGQEKNEEKEENKSNLGKMTESQKGRMRGLLSRYRDIFAREPSQLGRTTVVQHEIHVEEGPAIKQRFYPTSRVEHEFIGKEIHRLEQTGLIRSSNSPWASPVVLVRKKNRKLRLCVDFWKLNKRTKRDSYPLP